MLILRERTLRIQLASEAFEFGLGALHITDWTLTPYGTFRLQGHSGHERLGLRLESMDMRTGTLNVDLFGERHADQPFTPGLEGTLRFFFR